MENVEFTLKEEDIPGAKLSKSVDSCSVPILKRWLACRGAKVTAKLNELRKRQVYRPPLVSL